MNKLSLSIICLIFIVSSQLHSESYNNNKSAIFRRFTRCSMNQKYQRMAFELEHKLTMRKKQSDDYLHDIQYLNNYCLHLFYNRAKNGTLKELGLLQVRISQLEFLKNTNTPESLEMYQALNKYNSCWM